MNKLSEYLVNEILKENNNITNIVVVFSGRFQPFHKNHYNSYQYLTKKFGSKNVFIGTSNKTGSDSPFNFKQKQTIISTMFNIPKNKIIQIKSPYAPEEVLKKFNEDNTVFIAGLGEKDASRLIKRKYYDTYKNQKDLQPYKNKGYVEIIPLQSLKINGKLISGTEVRKIFSSTDNNVKKDLFKILYNKFNQSIYDLIDNKVIKTESYDKFIQTVDIKKLIKEVTSARTDGGDVDDGPATWYRKWGYYKQGVIEKAEQHGWKIINYILGGTENIMTINPWIKATAHKSSTYFPSGIVGKSTPTSYKDLKGKAATKAWLKDIRKAALSLGFKFISWKEDLKNIASSEKSSKEDFKDQKKVEKNTKKIDKSIQQENKIFSKEWWNKELILEGGAAGHMTHPFEDNNLTFGNFKTLINLSLSGNLTHEGTIEEKLDGQNLMISWKNGKLIAARNKGHIKNYGANAPDKNGIKDMFSGRGDIEEAFHGAMIDLEKAISSLSDKQKDKIFGEGKRFANLEIIYPTTQNVIPYDKSMIIFHTIVEYNESGKSIGVNAEFARILEGMIRQINVNIQKKFKITQKIKINIPKSKNFNDRKSYYLNKLNKLQKQFNLKDTDTLGVYHQSWWEEFINKKAKELNYSIPNIIFINLVKRWAFGDKSYKLTQIKKDLKQEPDFLDFVYKFDKQKHDQQMKENIKPFEKLFLELGAEIMSNINTFMSANPKASIQKIRGDVATEIKKIKNSKDISAIQQMEVQLNKIKNLGGFNKIVPSEGIVFSYNGKIYKYTGIFAPINQLLGILKYAR